MQTLSSKFETMKLKLIEIFREQKYICVTADVWSSRAQSYIGVTVHYISSTFERKSFLLAFRELKINQTYLELSIEIKKIFDDFEIPVSKVTNIVTDGGSAFCKAFKVFGKQADALIEEDNEVSEEITSEVESEVTEISPQFMQYPDGELFYSNLITLDSNTENFETNRNVENNFESNSPEVSDNEIDFSDEIFTETSTNANIENIQNVPNVSNMRIELPPQRRCMSHLLNLVSNDFEKLISGSAKSAYISTMNKLHSLWVLRRRSSMAKQLCIKIIGRSLLIPCETRWNSRYDAIERVFESGLEKINELIRAMKSKMKSAANLQELTTNDWAVITQYSRVMSPIAKSLDILQGEFNCSQGYILPTLIAMEHRISLLEGGNLLNHFRTIALQIITDRFGEYMQINDSNRELVLAAVSHPRFKTDFIRTQENRSFVQILLQIECLRLSNDTETIVGENIDSTSENTQDEFFVNFSTIRNVRRFSIEENINLEIQKFLSDSRRDDSILDEYPKIKNVYFKYNTTLSASAAVERVFSQSSLIFTPRRNRILAENFERTLMLKVNKNLLT